MSHVLETPLVREIAVNGMLFPIVSGREMHSRLMIRTAPTTWLLEAIKDYKLVYGLDFFRSWYTSKKGKFLLETYLSFEVAKGLTFTRRTEEARALRLELNELQKYFLEGGHFLETTIFLKEDDLLLKSPSPKKEM